MSNPVLTQKKDPCSFLLYHFAFLTQHTNHSPNLDRVGSVIIHKKFRLSESSSDGPMTLFEPSSCIVRYDIADCEQRSRFGVVAHGHLMLS